jgi:hypothetical protein
MSLPTKLVGIKGAAQDFLSALSERPKIVRLLLRWVFGKSAYSEFILLANEFIEDGYYMNYELEGMGYHKEKYRNDFSEGFKKY